MTHEQMLNQALRLGEEGNYANALKLWQTLCKLPGLSLEIKCVFLLNQRKCYSALGQYKLAEETLAELEQLDTDRQFWAELEHAQLDNLRSQGKFSEAYKRLVQFRQDNVEALASPRYADLIYEQNLVIAYHLINQNQAAEGLKLLDEVLPALADADKREAHYYCGMAHYKLRQDDAAISEFKQLLDPKENDCWAADANYLLGLIYDRRGALAWAKQHLHNAEMLKGLLRVPVPDVYMALSNVYAKLEELGQARRYRKLASHQGF